MANTSDSLAEDLRYLAPEILTSSPKNPGREKATPSPSFPFPQSSSPVPADEDTSGIATPTKFVLESSPAHSFSTTGARFDDSSPLPISTRQPCNHGESPLLSSSPPTRVRSPRDSSARDSWTDEMNSIALGGDVDPAELEAFEAEARNFENRRDADTSGESTDSTAMTPDEFDDTSDEKDDAEDIMNMPHMLNSQNEFTPVNLLQGLNALIAQEREPTSDETERLMQRREELEAELTANLNEYERQAGHNADFESSGPNLHELQEHAGAVPIRPAVGVVDAEQLNRILSVTNTAIVTENDSENSRADLSSPSPAQVPNNTPDRFPKLPNYDTTPPTVTMDQLNKAPPASVSLPASPAHAWNNVNFDPSAPTPSNAPLPLSKEKQDKFKDTVRPSSSRRISFAEKPYNLEDTPFTSTLKYFKSLKGHRRNASTPEELAELAREANDTSEPDEDLEQYREKDLAPLDPVMEANVAGDLITATTASPRAYSTSAIVDVQDFGDDGVGNDTVGDAAAVADVRPIIWYALEVPGTHGEENKIRVGSSSPAEDVADFIRMKAEELEASQTDIDRAVAKFLADPDAFVVDKDDEIEDIGFSKVKNPTFVKVVALLPKAMFWTVVKVGAIVIDKAYETLAEQFGRLHT